MNKSNSSDNLISVLITNVHMLPVRTPSTRIKA